MKIPLTPGQAVTIHGWFAPKDTLVWHDLLPKPHLTFRYLTDTCKLPRELLHVLQPDGAEWIRCDRATLADAPALAPHWGNAHPVHDFHADVVEILAQAWPAATLRATGVTYDDLMAAAGMTVDTMARFNFSLYDWTTLGFGLRHAHALAALGPSPDAVCLRLFRMPHADVLRVLAERRPEPGSEPYPEPIGL